MLKFGCLIPFLCVIFFATAAVAASSYDPAADRGRQGGTSDRSGHEATVAYRPAPGSYSNYCQTWRAYRATDRALFGACMADD